jgi:hypothetical protein
MEFNAFTETLHDSLGVHLVNILGALAILVVGWLIAVIARGGLRRGLRAIRLNDRVESSTGGRRIDLEKGAPLALFWLIIVITLVGVFNALDLGLISEPFQHMVDQVLGYLPNLAAGLLLLLVAWIVASLAKFATNRALAATTWDERLSSEADMTPFSRTAGDVLFWLVILLFVPGVLGVLELTGLLAPVQEMVREILGILPNIVAAFIIGFAGWLIGTVLRGLVTNLLAATGADAIGPRAGLSDTVKLSRVLGVIVFVLVFVPALIAALDALDIAAISGPATVMLGEMLGIVPDLIAAALILLVTWIVARFVADLVTQLLASVGIDAVPARLGITQTSDRFVPSRVAGVLVVFFAMLFAIVEAADRLGFNQVSDLVTAFIQFGADVLLGAAILLIGFWLAGFAFDAIRRTTIASSAALAQIARLAIIGLVLAMGLRAMGIADDIVNLAFGLTLGAVAVAFALAFGLGGREAAGRQMEHWLAQMRGER